VPKLASVLKVAPSKIVVRMEQLAGGRTRLNALAGLACPILGGKLTEQRASVVMNMQLSI